MNMRREGEALRVALCYFTRLPLPTAPPAEDALRIAVTYWPLMGWLVGGMAGLVWWLALRLWPPSVASGLSLAATLLLTGAIHEDGLADVCDGFGGGRSRDAVLAIMKDSRVGVFGVVGLVMVLGLKWETIAVLPISIVPALLVAGHSISRSASATLMATQRYVRPGNEPAKARALSIHLGGWRLLAVIAFGLAPLTILPWRYGWSLVAVALIRSSVGRWFHARIGGYTGDCLGAMQQVCELGFYLAALAVA